MFACIGPIYCWILHNGGMSPDFMAREYPPCLMIKPKFLSHVSAMVVALGFPQPGDAIEVLHDVGRVRHARPQHHLIAVKSDARSSTKSPNGLCSIHFETFTRQR